MPFPEGQVHAADLSNSPEPMDLIWGGQMDETCPMILSTTDLRPGCTVDVSLLIDGASVCEKYHFNSAHRDRCFTRVKAQWRVDCHMEVACYGHSLENGLQSTRVAWISRRLSC